MRKHGLGVGNQGRLIPELLRFSINFRINELQHEISNNVVCATSKGSDQPAHTCSLIRAFASRFAIP